MKSWEQIGVGVATGLIVLMIARGLEKRDQTVRHGKKQLKRAEREAADALAPNPDVPLP